MIQFSIRLIIVIMASTCRAQVTGLNGWDIFIDAEIEASVRSWLPHDPSLLNNGSKLLKDQLAGILMLQLSDDGEIELTLIDTEGTHVFSVVHYVDG